MINEWSKRDGARIDKSKFTYVQHMDVWMYGRVVLRYYGVCRNDG